MTEDNRIPENHAEYVERVRQAHALHPGGWCKCGDPVCPKARLLARREAEERQGRLDAALAECDREYPLGVVPISELPSPTQICDRIRAALVGDQPKAEEPTPEDFHRALTDVTEQANRALDAGNLDRQMQGRPPLPLFPTVPPLAEEAADAAGDAP